MKIMNCPLNGPRNISEFVWGGEVKPMPDPATIPAREWGEFAVAPRGALNIAQHQRQLSKVTILAVAIPESGEDPEHFKVALNAHPFEIAIKLAEIAAYR